MNRQPKKIYINRHPPTYRKKTMAEWRAEQSAVQRQIALNDQQESSPGCLCFFLGALLGPIGVVVAAIIGKADGVKAALFGLLIDIGLFVVVWLAIILVAARAG